MRVLILSAAILACATAAPSGALLTPLAPIGIAPAVILPLSQPTISPGDLQAATIDAQVQAQDLARAAEDQARHLTDQTVETQNENVEDGNELAKLKTEQQFWAEEELKWQALQAAQTAQAKLDGETAKNADILAKSVIPAPTVSLTSIIQPDLTTTAIVSPGLRLAVSPIAFATPGIIAPNLKSVDPKEPTTLTSDSGTIEAKPEETKSEIKPEIKLETTPIVKTTELFNGQSIVAQSLTQTHPINYAGLQYYGPALRFSNGLLGAPISYVQPEVKLFGTSFTQTHGFGPYIIRNGW